MSIIPSIKIKMISSEFWNRFVFLKSFFLKITLARMIVAMISEGSNTEYFEKKEARRVSWTKSFITP